MTFETDGAEPIPDALNDNVLGLLESAVGSLPSDRPGVRIAHNADLFVALASNGPVGIGAARFTSAGCRPVRVILFDKSEQTNWSLGWHQDRTIAVAEKIDVPNFGPWTVKAGIHHVEPPIELLERMVSLRVHLDRVDDANAPLLIAPGSHRLGRIPEFQIDAVVERCGIRRCLAERGDVWAYSTLILHASEAARRPRRRRVLQIDYSPDELPSGLRFAMA